MQTTRALVRGIAIDGTAQLIFVDTPGIFAPRRRLDRAMVTTAWGGAHDADIVALLIDAKRGLDEETDAILDKLGDVAGAKLLILNKIDLVAKPMLLALAQEANERARSPRPSWSRRCTGDGVGDLKALARRRCAGRAVALSGGPDLGRAAAQPRGRDHPREAVRPPAPGAALSLDGRDRACGRSCTDGAVRIEQTIFVERESQRKIVLGKGGADDQGDRRRRRAREIAEIIEQPVHLFLFVKVREGWGDDPERYREMGLEFPPE